MISKDSLHIDWITKVSTANRKADKILVEKVIRALLLLEGLATQKLDFVFKGGTALMLILESSKRLSIDVDIIVEKEP
ncbi:Nucleotidyl transferase AbiEii toxin, Type IV TA system [Algoriphagus hitonicola]|uniref:Nucleotidyl transferase AbiEii toxin, Type IV TA system n=1 Tax=Algoriphagus hitonicola TaxID=435880 RepID=A0A1I2XD80_9BACT|nr:Nucleotidyl transferase AbiEii toxin, Type IV TA system [Algoriphagus hitonicola]